MFKLTLNRVHDRVKISEGEEKLILCVDGDAGRMVAGISEAVKGMKALNDQTPIDDQIKAAQYFAGVIFGDDQAVQLMEFYRNDPVCVINLCSQYVSKRLSKLIANAQKKSK